MSWPSAICAAGVAGLTTWYFRSFRVANDKSVNDKVNIPVILSPRATLLPKLFTAQQSLLPYPPDLLLGSRDVATPYGTMRVYEWGPIEGRKILFVHGDTTPAPVLAPIAKALVARGCRVMLFDLWGRGYSDTPLTARHDAALYTTQIFFALASSPLSWTGESHKFSMIGFSLGGAITMSFAARFAYLMESIVLLAPAGLIRTVPEEYAYHCWRFRWLFPGFYLRRQLAGLLGVDLSPVNIKSEDGSGLTGGSDEVKVDSAAITQWQFDNHQGFQHSFIDTINHGPLQHQASDWQRVFAILGGDSTGIRPCDRSSGLFDSKVLIVCGDDDTIVIEEEVVEEIEKLQHSAGRFDVRTVPGTHGFPVPSADAVIEHIVDFWDLDQA